MKNKKLCTALGYLLVSMLCCLCGISSATAGGIGLDRSRLIFNENDTAQTVTMYNRSTNPYLVQTSLTQWEKDTPVRGFAVLPPLFRMEPQGSGAMRIVRTVVNGFPRDRESVFRLRISTIEGSKNPIEQTKSGAMLGISLGFSIKVFYRPSGLSMSQEEAFGKLTFRREKGRLVVSNQTPYYQTFASLIVGGQKIAVDAANVDQMVAPSGQVIYPLPTGIQGSKVEWTLINDFAQSSPLQKGQLQ